MGKQIDYTLWCWKSIVLLILLLAAAGCDNGNVQNNPEKKLKLATKSYEGSIIALGDSLTSGLGVDYERNYPALLQEKLNSEGYSFKVINGGVSGETSSGTLSRLSWILSQKPDIIILEIGANDGLRGISVELLRNNLLQIVERVKKEGVIIVFAGMKMVWNMGAEYTNSFNNVFQEVAEKKGVIYMDFFLQDVATVPELNIKDGIHPNEEGYAVIVDNLFPYVVEAIELYRESNKKNSDQQ